MTIKANSDGIQRLKPHLIEPVTKAPSPTLKIVMARAAGIPKIMSKLQSR